MILDVHGEMALSAAERDPFWHGPARQGPVALESKVVVEAPCGMSLDDEPWLIANRLRLPERLRRLARLPAASVLVQAHLWIVA